MWIGCTSLSSEGDGNRLWRDDTAGSKGTVYVGCGGGHLSFWPPSQALFAWFPTGVMLTGSSTTENTPYKAAEMILWANILRVKFYPIPLSAFYRTYRIHEFCLRGNRADRIGTRPVVPPGGGGVSRICRIICVGVSLGTRGWRGRGGGLSIKAVRPVRSGATSLREWTWDVVSRVWLK
jgi:hypothetical protein